ncbi:hypothetical protein E4T50_13095 [Aureobasidium sp. EXF-12298]|nr:hypothetical protein E4T50_13095 [Aureobasidium sp. EXF-12298]
MTSLSFSLGGPSSKSSRRPSPPPKKRTNGTKRDHAALLDDASDDEDATHTKRQTITHFDTAVGGAINAKAPKKEEKAPLVITALANRDWREASKRQRAQKYGISAEQLDARKEQHAQGNVQGADTVVKETDAVKYGLNVFAPSSALPEDIVEEEQQQQEEPTQQKTAEQLAIDALTGAAPTSTLTIPAAPLTEEDAFASTFHSAPPAPSLSDYTAVPVEEYGAAMLRGMGWKGPSTAPSASKPGKKALPPAKRPALLGIGADPNAAQQAEELGETLTEEELKNKIRRDKEEAENNRFVVNDLEIRDKKSSSRRDDGGSRRKDDSDAEEKRRRRDKERDRDYDRHDRSKDHRDRKDKRDRSRDHRDSKRDGSRDRYDKKSSHRRERSKSRDRDYERRDRDRDYDRRDREKDYDRRDRRDKTDSGKRDRYEDTHKSSSRRDRDGESYHRSSRR